MRAAEYMAVRVEYIHPRSRKIGEEVSMEYVRSMFKVRGAFGLCMSVRRRDWGGFELLAYPPRLA